MGVFSSFFRSFRSDPYVAVVATLILLCGLWGASVAHSCQGDGCIGIGLPYAAAAAFLVLQLVVCLPVLFFRRRRRRGPVGAALVVWAVLSIAAFALPLWAGSEIAQIGR
jgi:uncharacterized membrane protein